MYVPPPYRHPDSGWLIELMRRSPLALLVTVPDAKSGPLVTHLPVIMQADTQERVPYDLSNVVLLGHLNRSNPHWAALTPGASSLLVFTGPHAYVSPTIYEKSPAAPTWNFTSVHVHGSVHPIETTEETLDVVQRTVRAFETDFGFGWDMSDSLEYFREIISGVGAFRFSVTRADGMFKLSQEQPEEVRARVQKYFTNHESSPHREVAELMSRSPSRPASPTG